MAYNKMNSLNRIFTRNMLRSFIEGEANTTYLSTVQHYVNTPNLKINRELIHEIYCELQHNYRNEYFYKNTLLNKWLLGVHSVNTTTALTEVPIANSKADFILINGEAVVYEIKTELDNLDRLEEQIDDYYKAFNKVAVVTFKENLQQMETLLDRFDRPVGIYVLRKNGSLSEVRKPEKYECDLDGETIFKLLRKSEYEDLVLRKFGTLPEVTQFEYYSACKKLLLNISVDELYLSVIKLLKKRVKLEREEFFMLPYEIRFLAYFMELTVEDYQKLEIFLNRQYGGA